MTKEQLEEKIKKTLSKDKKLKSIKVIINYKIKDK